MSNPNPPSKKVRHKKPLVQRIGEALTAAGGQMHQNDLESALYPDPWSHRYGMNGGPPGCRWALNAGVRRGGFRTKHLGGDYSNRIIFAKTPTPTTGEGG